MIDFLFRIVLSEVVLGGGGRTFSVGPVSLRMLLFGLSVTASLVIALTSNRSRDGVGLAALLVFCFFASLLPGILVDAGSGTPAELIALELQPLLFWLAAPFFALALQDVRSVQVSAVIVMYGGLIVAAATTATMLGLFLGVVNFGSVYLWADRTNELFFRTTSNFFYKGHFFVGVAFIFFAILTPRWWKLILAILGVSLALSLTRGLYLAVIVAMALSFISARRSVAVIITIVVATTIIVIYGQSLLDLVFDPRRAISAEARSRDFTYFLYTFNYKTLLFGDGTGVLLNGRRNIENSLVWAIWRFGIAGLLFWLLPLFLSLRYFLQIPFSNEHHRLASAFFFGMVLLYVVTVFNPFINNSIGLMYILCAVFSLRRLSRSVIAEPALPARAT